MLVWSPGKGSPIHDHGNAHCLMKILKGDLTETRYALPSGDEEEPMLAISERTYKENAITYMADELGVHRVSNRGSEFAISLHRKSTPSNSRDAWGDEGILEADCRKVYTPPNVAKGGCHIFNADTSEKCHVKNCGYYSAYGKLLKDDEACATSRD